MAADADYADDIVVMTSESPRVEEVAIVHDGAATFFLGAQQARIVRSGQVVRVPAGVPHRWVATGERRLRAVAVHSAAEILTSPA